jgi:hypothetical protein
MLPRCNCTRDLVRIGGMNLDDPIDDEVPNQPSGKKQKTVSFCEHCGKSNHATKRSKKCTAAQESAKKYRKHDGSLLSDPPLPVQDAEDEDPMIAFALPVPDVDDCHDFDHEPLIHMPGEDGFDSDLFLNEDRIGEAGSVQDCSVAVVGGTL